MEEIRAIDFVLAYLTYAKERYGKCRGVLNFIIFFIDINRFVAEFKKKYGIEYDIDLGKKDWETAEYFYKGKIKLAIGDRSIIFWFTREQIKQLSNNIGYNKKHDKIIEVWKSIKDC